MEYTPVDLWTGRRRWLSLCSISFANQRTDWLFRFAMALDRGANLRMAGQLPSPRSGLRDQSAHERGLDQNRHDPPYGTKARLAFSDRFLGHLMNRFRRATFRVPFRGDLRRQAQMAVEQKKKTARVSSKETWHLGFSRGRQGSGYLPVPPG